MSSDEQLVKLIEHYQKALLINPRSDVIYHQLAELYDEQGNLEKTLETYQKALKVQPRSVMTSEALTKVFARLGFNEKERESLLESFSKTLTLEAAFAVLADVVKPLEELRSKADTTTWRDALILASALAQQEDWNNALKLSYKAIYLEPSLQFPHFTIQYFVLPEIDELESLANLYLQVIRLPKIHRLAYAVLGDILTKQHRLPEAIQAYRRAWLQSNYQISAEKKISQQQTIINYLIIGVGKAGTTSLFHYLSQHPQIINPHEKEIQFFNERYEYGLDWYLAQFPPRSFKKERFLTGEATPWYLGTIGAAERVFNAFPLIKLIILLRNPVSRTISHFYMSAKAGLENRSLGEAIADEMAILGNAENLAQVSETYWKTEHGYLWFSLYLPFLERWMSRFPKEQFLVLNSEDLYGSPSNTLKGVFKFLNIPDCDLISYPKLNLGSYPTVDDQLRKTLFDFFYKHNQELEEYLGMKFGWNDL
ncbi:MAG: sulfotransferase domain-containing protein [Stenomitos rutilans HA7619-LM2]|jgi:tetratricopeptide (TPR) repeat protein|nr:sulfotransferase domain-containing protein [Stenomitos rutilans HA7619-LM2]